MSLRRDAGVAFCLAGAAGAACAQGAVGNDTAWGAAASVVHRRLVERSDSGRQLVRERGPMLRLQLDAQRPLAGGAALQGWAAIASGRLDYRGESNVGAPLDTEDGHRDLELGLRWRPFAPAAWGEGWLVLQALQQRRQIASTPAAQGLRETSTLWMPGVRWTHAVAAGAWRLQPSVELRASVQHRLHVGFGGARDDAAIDGGRRREIALALDAAQDGSHWSWGIAWTHARQSASATEPLFLGGAPVGTVRQPRITIDDLALRVRRAF